MSEHENKPQHTLDKSAGEVKKATESVANTVKELVKRLALDVTVEVENVSIFEKNVSLNQWITINVSWGEVPTKRIGCSTTTFGVRYSVSKWLPEYNWPDEPDGVEEEHVCDCSTKNDAVLQAVLVHTNHLIEQAFESMEEEKVPDEDETQL